MDCILYILVFCIGTLFGSFFTLAVYRIPIGQDITHERSYCPNCNHKLSFLDMIPILSYVFLGGKCRYCKNKIRIRYLLLEILSGIVFVLFAYSIKLSVLNLNTPVLAYLITGMLYIAILFIIAGIDKENIKIEKPVLLFGFIFATMYIIYLYIVEKDTNMYRYVIYLLCTCVLVFLDTLILRKQAKSSYTINILLLSLLMILNTYEAVYIITITYTLLIIAISTLVKKIKTNHNKNVELKSIEKSNIPIAFYMCVCNIAVLIITNIYIFYG